MNLVTYFGCVFVDGWIFPVQAMLFDFDGISIFLISYPAKHFCEIFNEFIPVF